MTIISIKNPPNQSKIIKSNNQNSFSNLALAQFHSNHTKINTKTNSILTLNQHVPDNQQLDKHNQKRFL